jgi:4-amino-4-deoxy-L-arabinose transferase-like glycosyltransferase
MLPAFVDPRTARHADRTRALVATTLLILAGAALLARIVAIVEPLGIDQSLWASAVHGMARGLGLYVDVWEQRPPGIYLTYLTGFSLFGWTEATVAWLDIIAAAVTTVVLWQIGRRLADDLTGALAAALFALLTMPAGLYGYGGFLERSVCETFIVVCAGAAAWGATRLREGPIAGWALLVGVFGGLAALYKPNAALYLPAVALWWVLAIPAAQRTVVTVAGVGAWMIAGAMMPIVLTGIWLWQIGALPEARVAVIDFNRYYVTEGLGTLEHARIFADRVFLRFKTEPVWMGGVVASLVACWILLRTRRLPRLPALAMCWGAAATLVILVNGIRLFNSYFLQAHAPLCLMAAWWLASRTATTPLHVVGRTTLGVALLGLLVTGPYVPRAAERTAADWRRLSGQVEQRTHLDAFGGYANNGGYSARANQELADYIRARTTDDDTIFLFGVNGAGVYFLADRVTAHRFLRVNFFYPPGFPDPRFTVESVTRDLAARRPRYVMFEDLHATSAIGRAVSGIRTHPSVVALLEGYDFEIQIEDFAVYRRR